MPIDCVVYVRVHVRALRHDKQWQLCAVAAGGGGGGGGSARGADAHTPESEVRSGRTPPRGRKGERLLDGSQTRAASARAVMTLPKHTVTSAQIDARLILLHFVITYDKISAIACFIR